LAAIEVASRSARLAAARVVARVRKSSSTMTSKFGEEMNCLLDVN